jgi:hypothetical protein
MANDRMGIRCKVCGERFSLIKRMMNPWYITYSGCLEKKLREYLERHEYCFWKYDKDEQTGEFGDNFGRLFEIWYESDDD